MEMKKLRKAFTLAEILIVLAIIGVVAALTIPTLMNNIQDKEFETAQKKANSILANGFKLMMAKNDVYKMTDLPFITDCSGSSSCLSTEFKNVFSIVKDSNTGLDTEDLPSSYLIYGETTNSPFKWNGTIYQFITADGMLFGIVRPLSSDLDSDGNPTLLYMAADINGLKKPNMVSKDLYEFLIDKNGTVSDVTSKISTASTCTESNYAGCSESECQALVCHGGCGYEWNSSTSTC